MNLHEYKIQNRSKLTCSIVQITGVYRECTAHSKTLNIFILKGIIPRKGFSLGQRDKKRGYRMYGGAFYKMDGKQLNLCHLTHEFHY